MKHRLCGALDVEQSPQQLVTVAQTVESLSVKNVAVAANGAHGSDGTTKTTVVIPMN